MTAATTAPSPPLSFWNIANLVAYLANAAVVYSVGMYGVLGQGNNAELSAKYQTLLTPAGWAFSIWGIIYISQLVWAVVQVVAPRYRVKALHNVNHYNYILVCLAQIGWTIAFGYQIIWLSMIFMALILVFLLRIVLQARRAQQHHDLATWFKEYALLEFPFTLHAGWIMAATLLNANIVLVAYHVNVNLEIFAAIFSLVLVLVAGFVFLSLPDFTVPLALIWALTGIFTELDNPKASIRAKYPDNTVPLLQKAVGLAGLAIAVGWVLRLYTAWTVYLRLSSQHADESHRLLQEPLTGATTKHTPGHS